MWQGSKLRVHLTSFVPETWRNSPRGNIDCVRWMPPRSRKTNCIQVHVIQVLMGCCVRSKQIIVSYYLVIGVWDIVCNKAKLLDEWLKSMAF